MDLFVYCHALLKRCIKNAALERRWFVRARATSIILEGQKKGRNKVPLLSKKGSFINYIFSKSVIYDTLPPNCYLYYYMGIIYWSVQQQNYYLKQSATQRYFASVYIDKGGPHRKKKRLLSQKKLSSGILHRSIATLSLVMTTSPLRNDVLYEWPKGRLRICEQTTRKRRFFPISGPNLVTRLVVDVQQYNIYYLFLPLLFLRVTLCHDATMLPQK